MVSIPNNPMSNRPVTAEVGDFSARIYEDFFEHIGYDMNVPISELSHTRLLKHFVAELPTWNLPPHYHQLVVECLPLGILAGNGCAHQLPEPIRIFMAKSITLFFSIDTIFETRPAEILPDIAILPQAWLLHGDLNRLQNPVLRLYLKHLVAETPKHYGSKTTIAILKSTLDWLLGATVETRQIPFDPQLAPTYPLFLRRKSGYSEQHVHFLFPECVFPEEEYWDLYYPAVPDMIDIFDRSNDVLSFYKEAVLDDEWNVYIMHMAAVEGKTGAQVLKEECERIVRAKERIMSGMCEVLQGPMRSYILGYLEFHFEGANRYKLDEIGFVPKRQTGRDLKRELKKMLSDAV